MYRSELDGLRALAVTAVLVNHAKTEWLPGGFLGVDCFFVLSGYVVSYSWAQRKNEGASTFYQRRLRRLQPALVLMLLGSAALAWPAGLLNIGHTQTALASLVGISNVTLLSQSLDYFGAAAASNPFTHTWSLGVEEQFYLLFPLLFGRRRWLMGLCIGSLVLWLCLQLQHQEAAFYLTPARFWELGLGILIWQWSSILPDKTWLCWSGLTSLLLSFVMPLSIQLYSTPLAVFGSAALVIGLKRPSSLQDIFSRPQLTAIGKRAYGLYLWHWPLLVISRTLWPTDPWRNSGLPIVASIVISGVSYHWIEHPLRKAPWGYEIGLPIVAASAGLIAAADVMANLNHEGRSYSQFATPHRNRLEAQTCHSSKRSDALEHCLPSATSESPARIVLIGDSHAAHLRAVLDKLERPILQISDRNLPNLWMGRGCRERSYCFDQEEFLKQLQKSITPGSVVVLGLSPRRLTGQNKDQEKSEALAKQLKASLINVVQVVQRSGGQLLLIGALPQVQCPTGQSFESLFNRDGTEAVIKACSPGARLLKSKNKPLDNVYSSLQRTNPETVKIFESFALICAQNDCRIGNDRGKLFFWDDLAHLTPVGRQHLAEKLIQMIREVMPRKKK